jgi:hypothetical protein
MNSTRWNSGVQYNMLLSSFNIIVWDCTPFTTWFLWRTATYSSTIAYCFLLFTLHFSQHLLFTTLPEHFHIVFMWKHRQISLLSPTGLLWICHLNAGNEASCNTAKWVRLYKGTAQLGFHTNTYSSNCKLIAQSVFHLSKGSLFGAGQFPYSFLSSQ